jgi:hypothetical protein
MASFVRIKNVIRKRHPYVPMLIEISVRKIMNGFETVQQRLVLSAFVRVRMIAGSPQPLLLQNSTSPPSKQSLRRRDIVPIRK